MSMDAKNKLFGNLAKSEDEVRANTTTVPKPVSKTAGMDLAALMGGASIGSSVSPDIKENHIKDALAAVKSAERALVTSLFQWSPDYTCAAPMYERASSCYHSAEDYPNEIKYMLKCAECHEKNGGYSSSAFAYSKAGNIAQQNKKHKDSMKYFMLSAEQWGLSGDLNKYADFYAKAGLEGAVAGENSKSITMCFQKAMKIALPANLSSADQLKSVHPQVFDMSRRIFNYYVSQSDLIREAIALGMRLIAMYSANDMEPTANKLRASIVILELKYGDIVAADKIFMEFLQLDTFLKSSDCKAVEQFLLAFKFYDLDQLQKAQKSPDNYVFDREMMDIIRTFTFKGRKKEAQECVKSQPEAEPESEPESTLNPELDCEEIHVQQQDQDIAPTQSEKESRLVEEPAAADEMDEDEFDLT